ncbi:hypothetical protein CsSME_00026082 [Camellia sinensis var. sinensis]
MQTIHNLEKRAYLTDVAIDEHVAAIEISVNDTRIMSMQIVQTLENLFGPFLQSLHRDMFVLLSVLSQITRSTHFGNEVESVTLFVSPHIVQSNDVLVLQSSQQPNLRV